MQMRGILWAVLTAGIGTATATSITYTISAVGSGTLNENPFTNATLTFTQVTDTTNVFTNPSTCGTSVVCAGQEFTNTVNISGLGTFTLTDATEFFVNHAGTSAAGFTDDTKGPDLLDEDSSAFSSYGLTTALGPLVDPISSDTSNVTGEPTSGGILNVSSYSGNATFQAVPGSSSVPEPANLLLTGAGLLALLTFGVRSKRASCISAFAVLALAKLLR